MPKLYKIGRYVIFFWSDEAGEPIHVHISIAEPSPNTAKVWLTKAGGCIIAHNKGGLPQKDLNHLLRILQNDFYFICGEWKKYFKVNTLKFYC